MAKLPDVLVGLNRCSLGYLVIDDGGFSLTARQWTVISKLSCDRRLMIVSEDVTVS